MAFDKSKFIGLFKTETKEHLQNLNNEFLNLEKHPQKKEILETLMKEAHTVKGSATMMGYKRIADLAHTLESGLESAGKKGLKLQKDHFDLFFESLDTIESLLEDKVTWESKGIDKYFVESLCRKLEDVFSGKKPALQKLGKVEVKAVEEGSTEFISPIAEEEMLRVNIRKLDDLLNLSGELIISKIRLKELVKDLSQEVSANDQFGERFLQLIDDLNTVDKNLDISSSHIQAEIINMRMVPVSFLFNTYPRAMRDLAQERGKDVVLEIKGEDTQLDKGILDEMKDPLLHLLRNAVDHGIEDPKERQKKGKSKSGKIELSAFQKGSQIVMKVSDDGSGIDVEEVRKQAVNKGILSKEKAKKMTDEQLFQLLFTSGFSTREVVTEISGRGVGLDVVRDKIAKLKGMIEIDSSENEGTSFIMKLPLTLAITESLLVAAGNEAFAIPIDTIVETIRMDPEDIKKVGSKEAVTLRGRILPVVRLNELFRLPTKGIFEKKYFTIVVVQSVEKRVGLLVDRLIGRQEVLGKPLGDPLRNVRNISGATVLGDGNVILILDISSIIETAEDTVVRKIPALSLSKDKAKKKKNILLAEDVLTTAMLEKNVLESVGYSVVIARDGQAALKAASQERFDLVITDILMPKMDGFELTTRLKKDKYYKNIPVIIVTTRDSDADKRRGLTAGADAYILKSEFTSEGLLTTLERLIG